MNSNFDCFIHYRTPLVHTYHRLMDDKEINIVYFGGSITSGFGSSDSEKYSWRAKTASWFEKTFPDAKINNINSSIGESGTYLGVYRLQRDIISQKPDLLFIEYAVNDLFHETTREQAAVQFETIIREVRNIYPLCDIVTIITEAQLAMQDTKLYPAAQGHEDISEIYGIPSVLVGKALSQRLREKKEELWDKYFIDTAHPNDCGYAYYYKCIEEFLVNALKENLASIPDEVKEMPDIVSKNLLDGNRSFDSVRKDFVNSCNGFCYSDEIALNLQKTPYKGFVWAKDGSAEFIYNFFGTEMGIYTNFCNFRFSAEISYSLDGGEYKNITCSIHNPTLVVKDLPVGKHTVKIKPIFTWKTPDKFKVFAVLTRDATKQTEKMTKAIKRG